MYDLFVPSRWCDRRRSALSQLMSPTECKMRKKLDFISPLVVSRWPVIFFSFFPSFDFPSSASHFRGVRFSFLPSAFLGDAMPSPAGAGIAMFCVQSASPGLHTGQQHIRLGLNHGSSPEKTDRKSETLESKQNWEERFDCVMCSHLRKMAKRIFRQSFRSFALIISWPFFPPNPIMLINWPNTRFESRTFINQFFLPSGGIVYAICPWEHLFIYFVVFFLSPWAGLRTAAWAQHQENLFTG